MYKVGLGQDSSTLIKTSRVFSMNANKNNHDAESVLKKAKTAQNLGPTRGVMAITRKIPPKHLQVPLLMLAISLGILLDLTTKNEPNYKDKNEMKLRSKIKQLHSAFSLYKHYHHWLFSTLDQAQAKCNIENTNPLFFAVRMIDLYQECKTRPIKFKIDSFSIIDEGVALLDTSIMDISFEKAERLTEAIYAVVEEKDTACLKS